MARKRKHSGNNRHSGQVKQSQYAYQLAHNSEIAEYRARQAELKAEREKSTKYILATRSSICPEQETWLYNYPHLYAHEREQLQRESKPIITINGIGYY